MPAHAPAAPAAADAPAAAFLGDGAGTSWMRRETDEAPAAVAALLDADGALYDDLAGRWRASPPPAVLTVGRGSSSHAAGYFGHLAMVRLGCAVSALPMSVLTLYGAPLQAHGRWSLAFSQSGRSPDLVQASRSLRERGACTLAVVNDTTSPLAQACDHVLPVHAGPERSVAATKSCLGQMAAGARLVARLSGDARFEAALQALPEALQIATQADWSAALPVLQRAERLFVIGRGPGLPIAQEAALKLKETCDLPAEAFSGAEVEHGPKALVGPGFTVLVFAPRGPAQAGLLQTAEAMRARGAQVLLAAPAGTPGAGLPVLPVGSVTTAGPEDLDPLTLLQSFYRMVEALARARGLSPDAPRHLAKVTHTL